MNKSIKARKKPVTIEAIKYTGTETSYKACIDFVGNGKIGVGSTAETTPLLIDTLEGVMKVSIGDYIIKGVEGEFYPCKPDIFHKTYDLL